MTKNRDTTNNKTRVWGGEWSQISGRGRKNSGDRALQKADCPEKRAKRVAKLHHERNVRGF